MADFEASGGGGNKHGKGKVRGKKMSTRVDLTAMVDLAFLLITFFMLTTSLNKPKAMELNMPKENKKDPQKIKESAVLNVLLSKDDVVWYYEGLTVAGLKQTTFAGDDGIRKVILKKQKTVERVLGDREKTIVLIKMMEDAKYKNMVDILDEMDVTDTKIYAIQDVSDIEKEAIANGGNVATFATEGGQ